MKRHLSLLRVGILTVAAASTVAASPSPPPAATLGAPGSPAPSAAPSALSGIGLAWQRVADRDLVSYPRNGSMYGVMAGGPGAIAWGQVYATGPRTWTTTDGLDSSPASVETSPDGIPEYQ